MQINEIIGIFHQFFTEFLEVEVNLFPGCHFQTPIHHMFQSESGLWKPVLNQVAAMWKETEFPLGQLSFSEEGEVGTSK